MPDNKPTNLREMRKQDERRTLWMAVVLLIVVGGGMVGLIFGLPQMLAALPFLFLGAAGILLLYWLVNVITRWANND